MVNLVDTDLAVLQQASHRTLAAHQTLRRDTSSIDAMLASLEDAFEGDAANELKHCRQVLAQEMSTVSERLNLIGKALQTTRDEYAATDAANANNINGQPSLLDSLRGATVSVSGVSDGIGANATNEAAVPAWNDERQTGSSGEVPGVSGDTPQHLIDHPAVHEGERLANGFGSVVAEPVPDGRRYRAEWAALNPIAAAKMFISIEPAVQEVAAEWVGENGQGWQLEDGTAHPDHTGKSNAFRHALLYAAMTADGIDESTSIELGVAHEMDGDTPGEEWGTHDSYSDLVNNKAGAAIGLEHQGKSVEELAPIIAEIVENDGHNPYGTDLDLTSPRG
ncbi:WXG100 family type VII secretion target [Natronoglycomyces albus]|uniref:WXG100 family type VII secretion target n=1 Tax=Natronoglycomyces albus TaxID=2811108 RepID=A0A895XT75_9ACTN|nr:WXG100 family type VII secretion target [Natronoglycomyces albus]QSB04838.1 WXG100 family type VII secretion target [Natronoglycomyces albus]